MTHELLRWLGLRPTVFSFDGGVGEAAAAEGAKGAGEAVAGEAVAGEAVAGEAGAVETAGEVTTLTAAETAPMDIATANAAGAGVDFGSLWNTAKAVSTVLSPIASLTSAASGVSAARKAGSLVGAPLVSPPITMPTMGSFDTLRTQQASMTEQMQRRGRAATILTSPDSGERLGS